MAQAQRGRGDGEKLAYSGGAFKGGRSLSVVHPEAQPGCLRKISKSVSFAKPELVLHFFKEQQKV